MGRLGLADLAGEPPTRPKPSSRVGDDAVEDLGPLRPGDESDTRLMADIGRKHVPLALGDVRGVGDEKVDRPGDVRGQRVVEVTGEDLELEPEPAGVGDGDGDGVGGDVGRQNPGRREGVLEGQGEGPRAGAQVDDDRRCVDKRAGEVPELLGLRPRDEDTLVDEEVERSERRRPSRYWRGSPTSRGLRVPGSGAEGPRRRDRRARGGGLHVTGRRGRGGDASTRAPPTGRWRTPTPRPSAQTQRETGAARPVTATATGSGWTSRRRVSSISVSTVTTTSVADDDDPTGREGHVVDEGLGGEGRRAPARWRRRGRGRRRRGPPHRTASIASAAATAAASVMAASSRRMPSIRHKSTAIPATMRRAMPSPSIHKTTLPRSRPSPATRPDSRHAPVQVDGLGVPVRAVAGFRSARTVSRQGDVRPHLNGHRPAPHDGAADGATRCDRAVTRAGSPSQNAILTDSGAIPPGPPFPRCGWMAALLVPVRRDDESGGFGGGESDEGPVLHPRPERQDEEGRWEP